MNNIYYDYIGAKGSYEINDYVDNVSNVLNKKIDFTSNILEIHSSNYTNNNITILDNKYNKLIKTVDENITTPTQITLKHTYITNSNIQGQIRFITRFDTDDYRYKTRIKENGEIEVYYENFNPIYPTMFVGWYNVMGSIRDAYNYQNIATELIGGALFAINDIYKKYYGLLAATGATIGSMTGQQLTKEKFAEITIAASKAVKYNKFNETQAILGITGLGVAAFAASVFNGVAYDTSVRNILYDLSNLDLNVYSNITQTEKNTALINLINDGNANITETNVSLSNLNILNGFINSNITTPQLIPKITTNEITYNGVEISTTLNNYVLKDGGTMTGRLNFNYGAGIFGTPVGGGGGSGERINLNTNGITATDFPPSLGVSGNSLWFSSPANHSYQWFNNGNQLMSLTSSGQLILNNPITTAERQYPPKAYTSSTNEGVITFLGQSGMLSSTITLNPIGITYGSGVYEIYSSSRYDVSNYQKRELFNYVTTTNEIGGHWAGGQYSSIGVYQGVAYIKPDYLGDFLVVKLPNPIILTKFRFYPRLGFNSRIPGEFKFYGSMNNIDYTEITQASQITPRLTTNDIINGYYEKTLAAGFNTPYLYIGFAVNKLIGTSNPDTLNFQEFQIYGKEVLSSTASLAIGTSDASTYALNVNGVVNASSYIGIGSSLTTLDYNNITLNKPLVFPPDPTAVQTTILSSTPNVSKKYMLQFTCTTPFLMPNGITYYKYDIDLRNYTQTKIINNPNTPYRIFKIKLWIASGYYEYLYNGNYNVLSYEVFMSNQSQGGGGGIGSAGINLRAIGTPENPILNGITPTQISLVRSADFNFICCLAIVNNTQVYSIIEDCLF
jgi:hypothetical protein